MELKSDMTTSDISNMSRYLIYISFLLLTTLFTARGQVAVTQLRCEWLSNPLGIDTKKPTLSWQLQADQRSVQQMGYEIIVSSSKEMLQNNQADIWESGHVHSSASIRVPYQGKPLRSGMHCWWKVRSATNKGMSAWSEAASWTMGLLHGSDWKAKWIGYDKPSPWDSITQWSRLSARYFRKGFALKLPVKRATVYICGLGLYELYINGHKIGDQVLTPAPTDYRKTVLYNTYDVTAELNTGENTIATVLGNGRFFTMRQAYKPKKINTFGYPKMLLQLEIEYADGSRKVICSDATWKLNVDGPVRSNNEYDGEEYDARKEFAGWNKNEFKDTGWMAAALVTAPAGRLKAQMNPTVKFMRTINPVSIKKAGPAIYVLDMGQNFSGWVQLQAKGNAGDRVTLRFAESLQPDGRLYTANLRDAKSTDSYTLKGQGTEIWQPSFVYHGFRYVEISGYPGTPALDDFQGKLLFDDLAGTGQFMCSDTTINTIVRNAWWGIASNYKGMPIDCPQRNERQPWLGDRATGSGGESFLFDNAMLYAKWLDDIEDAQTPAGAIPDVAPAFWNYYSDNVTWPGTYILVADMLHRQFGDVESIRKHYASMKKWMLYMKSKYMTGFIVTKDKYGDWCVPPERLDLIRSRDSLRNTNGQLIATAYYYQLLQIMKRFAVLNGQPQDVKSFDALAAQVKNAFNKKFFRNDAHQYDNNTVTANLLPMYFGMVPAQQNQAVFNNICKRLDADQMHISTGVIGTQWLLRALTKNNRADAAFTLASNTSYPSWGYMAAQGATTIWELWNGNTANPKMNSQNHVMLLGDFLIWLFEDLAGISSNDAMPAFRQIIMKPSFVNGLNEVDASYESPYGKISSHWIKTADGLQWNIEVPANATALVYVPASSDHAVKETNGGADATLLRFENNVAVYQIGSGKYQFVSTQK